MGSKNNPGVLSSSFEQLHYPDILTGVSAGIRFPTEKRLAAFYETVAKVLREKGPVFWMRRIRGKDISPALSHSDIRPELYRRIARGEKLASRLYHHFGVESYACKVCGEVHDEGIDVAREFLGWSCTRVQRYVQKAGHSCWVSREMVGRVASMEIFRRIYPFVRQVGENDQAYLSRLLSLSGKKVAAGSLYARSICKGNWFSAVNLERKAKGCADAVAQCAVGDEDGVEPGEVSATDRRIREGKKEIGLKAFICEVERGLDEQSAKEKPKAAPGKRFPVV